MMATSRDTVTVVDPADGRGAAANPFPGPKSYRKADTGYFFGREDEIEELASLVLSTSAVLLFGPSGAGKSSLLEAGLVPYLEERKVGILPTVHLGASALVDDTTGNRFVRTVCDAIAKADDAGRPPDRHDMGSLAASYRTADSQRILLILDQFEEVFNRPTSWAERVDFFKALTRTLRERPWLRALVSMRSDYLAEIVPYERHLPANFAVRYQIENLTESQASEAIEAAFATTGVALSEQDLGTLLDQLLQQPADDGRRTVRASHVNTIQLQILCRRLWDLRSRPGSAGTSILPADATFTLQDSMKRFVDEALRTAIVDAGSDETAVRVWLRDRLITASGTRAFVQVEEQRDAGLPDRVIDSLIDVRLLQSEHRNGSRLLELTHDSMVAAVQASNDAWIRQHDRRRKRRALVLLLLLAGIILPLPYLRVPRLAEHPTGTLSAGEVKRIPFGGTEGAAAIDLKADGPADGTLSATVSRIGEDDSEVVLERETVRLRSEQADTKATRSSRGATTFGVPTEPLTSYVLTLSTDDRNVLYDVSITGIPLVANELGQPAITTPRFGVELPAGRAVQLNVGGDLTSVQGADLLAADYDADWAIVRRSEGGLAILNLENTVSSRTPGELTRTDLPPPTTIELNDPRELQVGSGITAKFVVGKPDLPLVAEATCRAPVDLTLADGPTGTSIPPQRGQTRTLLPLKVSQGSHELLLTSQFTPNRCTVSVREVDERVISAVEPQAIDTGPGDVAAAYALRFPNDVVIVGEQAVGATASISCDGNAADAVAPNPKTLIAFVSTSTSCTLWLTRHSADGPNTGATGMQLFLSPVTSRGT
jgi:hypothetical protein